MSSDKRLIKAEDLYKIELITAIDISPDGRTVIYSLQWIDAETEKKFSNLWIAPTSGGPPRRFTYGEHVDRKPKWSPDGSQIAFISNREDEDQPQIYLIPLQGGEARPLTDLPGEFGVFEWSPDGKNLVCQFRKLDTEAIARQEDEHKKKLGIIARHVDRLFYRLDGTGYLPKERWHLWTIDAETGEAGQLTYGDIYDEGSPTWSPDGKWIAFISNRQPDPDSEPDADDLYLIPSSGGEMQRIETSEGPKSAVRFSPDGAWLSYVGRDGRGDWWKNNNLWIVPIHGTTPPKNLTGKFDLNVSAKTINDVIGAKELTPPVWDRGGKSLYFQVTKHGNIHLMSISLEGENLTTVIDRDGVVGSFSFSQARDKLAYFFADMNDPGQVWVRNTHNESDQQLTHIDQALLEIIDLGGIEEVWFQGPAGDDLQGWILKPPGFDPNQKYPSILEIHGGPLTQYGNLFMHEFYFLAAQGYVVYFCNPRGGSGYGEDHAKAIWGGWGEADYADLMAWSDYMASKPYIDPERMGVTGGSYGGYMTLWIIGHTDRYQAAVAQRVVSNFVSMWGSSDRNWIFQQILNDLPPWEDLQKTWHHSPMAHISNAKTPTLIIHSENDYRCPLEQGQQAFVALKRLGVETEMILFPNEPHGLSRSGRTDRRIARLNHILRWFDKYLKVNR